MNSEAETKQIDWQSFTPVPGFPPVQVCFEISADASQPSAIQLELLRRVHAEFPRLWSLVTDDLLRSYDFEVFRCPERTLTSWHVFIPTWDYFGHEPHEVESIDTYLWIFAPWFADAPELEAAYGIDARFEELAYRGAVILY